MDPAEARREARRRRILQNSDSRLRKIKGEELKNDEHLEPPQEESIPEQLHSKEPVQVTVRSLLHSQEPIGITVRSQLDSQEPDGVTVRSRLDSQEPIGITVRSLLHSQEPIGITVRSQLDSQEPDGITVRSRLHSKEPVEVTVRNRQAPQHHNLEALANFETLDDEFVPSAPPQAAATGLVAKLCSLRLHIISLAIVIRLCLLIDVGYLFGEMILVPLLLMELTLFLFMGELSPRTNSSGGLLGAALILSGITQSRVHGFLNAACFVKNVAIDLCFYLFVFCFTHALLEITS